MSRAKAKSDIKDNVIRFLTVICICLVGIAGHAHYKILSAPEDINCYIPPDISNGGQLTRQLPEFDAYVYAREVNQQLRRCEEDCSVEFEKNIKRYANLISPKYKAQLLKEAKEKKSRNRNRVRYVSEVGSFEWSKVDPQKDGSMLVKLQVKEVEYVGTQKVRVAVMEYPFIVRPADVDRQKNPWKLHLDGTKGNPIRFYDKEPKK